MARVEDYNSYISGKNKNFTKEYYFIYDLKYTDIYISGAPPEILNVDDARCQVEYEAIIERNKMGIDGITFVIHRIEIEIEVDDYPNEKKKFEFEIEPGININSSFVVVETLDKIIPTYPESITLDMKKSMDVKDFRIYVKFGSD
jgi:hypothetical protein